MQEYDVSFWLIHSVYTCERYW